MVCLLPSPAVHPYPNSAVKRELGVFLTADTTPVTHKDTIIFAIKFWFIHLSFSQNGSLESCVCECGQTRLYRTSHVGQTDVQNCA